MLFRWKRAFVFGISISSIFGFLLTQFANFNENVRQLFVLAQYLLYLYSHTIKSSSLMTNKSCKSAFSFSIFKSCIEISWRALNWIRFLSFVVLYLRNSFYFFQFSALNCFFLQQIHPGNNFTCLNGISW